MVAAMVPRGQQAQDLAVRHHKADFVVRVTIWGWEGAVDSPLYPSNIYNTAWHIISPQ